MNKHYKQFYEIGNNRYFTLSADGDTYIATNSFIKVANRFKFMKQKDLIQGLKLLKMSTPITILFGMLANIEPTSTQKSDTEELKQYEILDPKAIKDNIKMAYDIAITEQINELQEWYNTMIANIKKELDEKDLSKDEYKKELEKRSGVYKTRLDRSIQSVHEHSQLGNIISLENPKGNKVIKSFLENGLHHLFTEKVTGFASNVYLYEQDQFGTLTIYRIITVKNVIKTIDTYIYDRKLAGKLLEFIYEKENK